MSFNANADIPRRSGRVSSLVVFCLLIIAATAAFWYRYTLYDWWRLRGYQAPATVVTLADETTMKPSTRRVFYANRPAIEDGSKFNEDCRTGEKTIVLGCFVNGVGIYLFDVTDERLKGVEEVTAAHETLHAVYARLNFADKKRVDAMTARAYADVKDERIRTVIENYRQSGADVPNELHSILGTEVGTLPADLEAHYAQYFSDRSAIVAYSEKYEQEFTRRKQQVAAYDTELKQLKVKIDQLSTSLSGEASAINAEYNRLSALKNSGQVSAYNNSVADYNRSVTAYNRRVAEQEQLISQYNDIVKARNAIALEENELAKAIDSRPQALGTQ